MGNQDAIEKDKEKSKLFSWLNTYFTLEKEVETYHKHLINNITKLQDCGKDIAQMNYDMISYRGTVYEIKMQAIEMGVAGNRYKLIPITGIIEL